MVSVYSKQVAVVKRKCGGPLLWRLDGNVDGPVLLDDDHDS
jgi:hypothetical protein